MASDSYTGLPDDENVPAILADYKTNLQDLWPGFKPSDAALEIAIGAALSEEASTLYALMREDDTDDYRDFGEKILGVPSLAASPAQTTTTWTARNANGPYDLPEGTQLVIDGDASREPFEVVRAATLPAGQTVLTGVLVQALNAGPDANGITGPVLFDEPPPWVLSATVDAPASGGADATSDEEYLEDVKAEARELSRVPILPEDFARAAQRVPTVERCLAIDLYDVTTDTTPVERCVSLFPIDEVGESTARDAVAAYIAARREQNWKVRVGTPTYSPPITADIYVIKVDPTADEAELTAQITAAATGPLSPANHGQPALGERRRWLQRRTVYRGDLYAAVDALDGVDQVTNVQLNGADADVHMTGAAPLPRPGAITVHYLTAT